MALIHLQLSPARMPRSSLNGATLSSEKIAIQRLLRTCGPRLRTMCGSILLDLIVFNRISPEMARHLNILSLSHWTCQASPSIRYQEIPLSTVVDSICLEKKIAGLSLEMKRLLNVWNLIGLRS